MTSFGAVGTQIQLMFQTKFPTFTPEQFSRAMTEREFILVRGKVPNPENPQGPLETVQLFSKGNVNVYLGGGLNQVHFQILNMLNLNDVYIDVKKILLDLNVISNVISNIGFLCVTTCLSPTKPQDNLTALMNSSFLESMSRALGVEVGISSIRLATTFPLEKNGVQMLIEPLGTSPEDHFYLNIIYRSSNMDIFNVFIEQFGRTMIQEIIEEVCKYG